MKALTLHQPYASLVVLGIKEWETLPHPFNGDMRPVGVRGLPGLRIDRGERIAIHAAASWEPGWLGDYLQEPILESDEFERLCILGELELGWDAWDRDVDDCAFMRLTAEGAGLPLGAIVGYVTVADTLPIVESLGGPDDPLPRVCNCTDEGQGLKLMRPFMYPSEDISDQLPYGHWLPGNWASLLVDPEPCSPIPANGEQGVWEWTR